MHLFFGGADDGVVFVVIFEEIGDVEKRVAFQSDIDESGLHAGKNPSDTSFMDAAG